MIGILNSNALRALALMLGAAGAVLSVPAIADDNGARSEHGPKNFEVTEYSVGPIFLGNTIGEAKEAATAMHFVRGGGPENTIVVDVMKGETRIMSIFTNEQIEYDEDGNAPAIDDSAIILGIDVVDAGLKTGSGIHVGMDMREAQRVLGDLTEMHNMPHMGEIPTFARQPDFLALRAAGATGTAGRYQVVKDCPDETYPPLCSVAKSFNPGAIISGMSIGLGTGEPQLITEVTGLPKGFKVIRHGPSDEQCKADNPITAYMVWSNLPESSDFQRIEIADAAPCVNDFPPFERLAYADQRLVQMGDFNFDGVTDLALYKGNNGGYGSPTYKVYFYDQPTASYVENEAFSELTMSLGMFEVDEAEKRLYVYSKSGAAWNQKEGYAVADGNKLVKVYEQTTEYTGPGEGTVTTKTKVAGKWKTSTKVVAE